MTTNLTLRGFAVAAVAATACVSGGASPAHAGTSRLTVAAAGAPVWNAGNKLPINIVVSNPDAQLMCDSMNVRLSWVSPNGKRHGRSAAGHPTAGAWSGTITIPARAVTPGALRYSVKASETCGMFFTTVEYIGSSPRTVAHIVR
ncbi:MAG: hypothetical protein JO246_01650 [Frankiaceae bacterium]|nr:hypothetical protein [Frankiaceae bacterium]MBV9871390.1 hypothetical protein [Frankiaceae bacterium]